MNQFWYFGGNGYAVRQVFSSNIFVFSVLLV